MKEKSWKETKTNEWVKKVITRKKHRNGKKYVSMLVQRFSIHSNRNSGCWDEWINRWA